MKHNPTELEYDLLEPNYGPKFGVSDSQSTDFNTASRSTYAWFISFEDAQRFIKGTLCHIWDLEQAIKLA
jgi:hypothetical protein